MRLAERLDRIEQRVEPRWAAATSRALELAWCERHGLDPDETLGAGGRAPSIVLILGGTRDETDALLADWPGGPVVVLPPLVDE